MSYTENKILKNNPGEVCCFASMQKVSESTQKPGVSFSNAF